MDSYFYLQMLLIMWMMISSMVNSYVNILDDHSARATSSSTLVFGPFSGNAAKTIDGNYNQTWTECMYTKLRQSEAWLMIDIGNIVNIKSVKIWYRNDGLGGTNRLRGFSIFASNNSTFHEIDRCYQDRGDKELDTVFEIPCLRTARYIKIYTDKPYVAHNVILEICEVEIYGCPRRKFAANCTTCDYCKNDCDVNGQCDAKGCAHFRPPFCTECNLGYYGRDCSRVCGHCSENTTCDHVTGSCPSGHCEPGWKHTRERRCDQECDDGAFGLYCSFQCNGHCARGMACNKLDGSCPGGCADGWINRLCNEKCKKDYYGRNCSRSCGHCADNEICDHVTGSCPSGHCEPGWKHTREKRCDQACSDGWYGRECQKQCGYCDGSMACHHVTGKCPALCQPGYHGERCNEKCDEGTYGFSCEQLCSGHCAGGLPCNRDDGRCLGGCQDGWINSKCDEKCERGYYGRNCIFPCGHCADNEACNHVTGSCPSGLCEPGWKPTSGRRCDQECDNGRFGLYCGFHCSEHCALRWPCDKVNGLCPIGCEDGWIKHRCNESCNPGWYGRDCQEQCGYCDGNMSCHHVTGKCPALCQPGYYGERCNEVCMVGYFGGNCSRPCGHCADNETCDHVTGSCPSGYCEPGWKPTSEKRCDQECPEGTYGAECKSKCSEGCLSVCDKKNGTCEKCREGYTGAFCIDAHAFQRQMTSILEVAGITTSVACFSILFALVLRRERLAAM